MNSNFFETLALRQLFGSTQVWLTVALLVGLFLLGTFRPENVRSPILFRLSVLLFVISLVSPALQDCFWSVALDDPTVPVRPGISPMGGPPGPAGDKKVLRFFAAALHLFDQCLFAGSILCALLSVRITPAPATRPDRREPPARRPGPQQKEDDDDL
jgi:hypothetical protein